jgi:hypothetical protein
MNKGVRGKGVEKRAFERIKRRYPVRFLDLKQGREVGAQTQDVSAKGLGLLSDIPVERHTPLKIWLNIPDRKKPFYTQGRVAWVESVGARYKVGVNLDAVEFIGLSRLFRS